MFDVVAIGAGIVVLFGMVTGELLDKVTVLFLRSAIATSVTWLILPFDHFVLTQRVSMLSIYASSVAILAWRKFDLVDVWPSIFALNITVVLYLSILIALTQIFNQISVLKELNPTHFEPAFLAKHLLVIVLFVVLGVRQ